LFSAARYKTVETSLAQPRATENKRWTEFFAKKQTFLNGVVQIRLCEMG
jgi:hypothetical protein